MTVSLTKADMNIQQPGTVDLYLTQTHLTWGSNSGPLPAPNTPDVEL